MKNRKTIAGKRFGLDDPMTPAEACNYAKVRFDVQITPNMLALLRRDGRGPKYLQKNGRWIFYSRRYFDPFVMKLRPRVIDPAKRLAGAAK